MHGNSREFKEKEGERCETCSCLFRQVFVTACKTGYLWHCVSVSSYTSIHAIFDGLTWVTMVPQSICPSLMRTTEQRGTKKHLRRQKEEKRKKVKPKSKAQEIFVEKGRKGRRKMGIIIKKKGDSRIDKAASCCPWYLTAGCHRYQNQEQPRQPKKSREDGKDVRRDKQTSKHRDSPLSSPDYSIHPAGTCSAV